MYAKLVEGKPIFAPPTVTVGERVHYHPSDALYRLLGWLPVIENSEPELDEGEPKYYTETWVERDGSIVHEWVECDPPELEIEPEVGESELASPSVEARISALEEAMLTLMIGGGELV